MKKISLKNPKAADLLTAELDKVQARCTARTITAAHILDEVEEVEARINAPACHLRGVEIEVDPNGQKFPNAYKYVPESTHFRAVRTSNGWTVTDIFRAPCMGPESCHRVKLTEEAEAAILDAIRVF